MKYKKLTSQVEFESAGIHTGEVSRIVLKPDEKISSIKFVINEESISADVKNVVDTTQATSLGNKKTKILTVEHLLSTIYCLYLIGIEINVYGSEIPTMDGSAGSFVDKIISCGIVDTQKEIKFVKVNKPIKININNSSYEIIPSEKFIVNCKILTSKSKFLNNKELSIEITPENFVSQIAYAKTFCLFEDVEKIRSKGLGRGGNLNNVIIIDNDKILNPEIVKYKDDEPLRHKILDFLGDLSLTNTYFNAEFKIVNPSHYTNIEFCKYLLKTIYYS